MPVGELGDQPQRAAHGLDVAAQRRQQHVATALDLRNAGLIDVKPLCHALLCEVARLPQVAQRHFLGNEPLCARLYPGAPLRRQLGACRMG